MSAGFLVLPRRLAAGERVMQGVLAVVRTLEDPYLVNSSASGVAITVGELPSPGLVRASSVA